MVGGDADLQEAGGGVKAVPEGTLSAGKNELAGKPLTGLKLPRRGR